MSLSRASSMQHAFLRGVTIYLRALERRDLDGNYFQWLNDEEVCRHNSHAVFPNSEKRMADYFAFAQDARDAVVFAIVTHSGDRHIGNVSLLDIDWIGRSANFAILIGEREFWGTGVGHEAGTLVVEYGFERLNLHRIYCGTSSNNIGMQKLAEKLHMVKEGVRRQALYKLGEYVDIVEYGLLRDEYLARGAEE